MRTQIPPLPLPVNADTPENPLHTQISFENITHVQPDLSRIAWKYLLAPGLLDAERWQAFSSAGDDKVLYESREVFSGPLASVLKGLMEKGLQQAAEAQAQGLKLLLEGSKSERSELGKP